MLAAKVWVFFFSLTRMCSYMNPTNFLVELFHRIWSVKLQPTIPQFGVSQMDSLRNKWCNSQSSCNVIACGSIIILHLREMHVDFIEEKLAIWWRVEFYSEKAIKLNVRYWSISTPMHFVWTMVEIAKSSKSPRNSYKSQNSYIISCDSQLIEIYLNANQVQPRSFTPPCTYSINLQLMNYLDLTPGRNVVYFNFRGSQWFSWLSHEGCDLLLCHYGTAIDSAIKSYDKWKLWTPTQPSLNASKWDLIMAPFRNI